jgi:hypothetical protein
VCSQHPSHVFVLLVNVLNIIECKTKHQCYEIQHVYFSLCITGDHTVTNVMQHYKSIPKDRNANTVCRMIKNDAAVYSDP